MTIVIGRKFGDRIVLASDTMISYEDGTRPDIVPGRLKVVVLDPKLSIGYANFADQALRAICRAKKAWDVTRKLDDVIDILIKEHSADFLVASHVHGAQLFKIFEGQRSDDQNEAFIGSSNVVRMIIERESILSTKPEYPCSLRTKEETRFRDAFIGLFMEQGVSIESGVGGVPIFLLGSPLGHTYDDFVGVSRWDPIEITGSSTGTVPEPEGGMASWGYGIKSSRFRGVAVVGLTLRGLENGYIYAPLNAEFQGVIRGDEAGASGGVEQMVQDKIDNVAALIGGCLPFESPPPEPLEVVDVSVLRDIAKYANAARHRTSVTLTESGLWVSCRSERGGQASMISYNEISRENLKLVYAIIDHHNAVVSEHD